jgi:F420-non-reducing hydrogenase iron-sulfur subunit
MNFEPKLLGFLCQQSGDLCADFAGLEKKNYAPNFLPVKLPCLGSLDTLYLMKAFFSGADGILVSGCFPEQCHHKNGSRLAKNRVNAIQILLETIGIEKDRLVFWNLHSSETLKLVETINEFKEHLSQLGPSPLFQLESETGDQDKFYWLNQLKKCDQCHRCKEVCPVYFCKGGYFESFPNFGISWLVHVMERCTVCGRCENVCSQGIRLFEIVQLLHPLTLPLSISVERGGMRERSIE